MSTSFATAQTATRRAGMGNDISVSASGGSAFADEGQVGLRNGQFSVTRRWLDGGFTTGVNQAGSDTYLVLSLDMLAPVCKELPDACLGFGLTVEISHDSASYMIWNSADTPFIVYGIGAGIMRQSFDELGRASDRGTILSLATVYGYLGFPISDYFVPTIFWGDPDAHVVARPGVGLQINRHGWIGGLASFFPATENEVAQAMAAVLVNW